jgi:glycosyltransferase involved in cell wall biosynthesis
VALSFQEISAAVLQRAKHSAFVHRIYPWVELCLGRFEKRRGRQFRAVEHFCKASRRVDVNTASRQEARKELKNYFCGNGDENNYAALERDFLSTRYAGKLRTRFLSQPFPSNITFRQNLMVLKPYNQRTGEKGVLILAFNYLFQAFQAIYRAREMSEYYWMIFEPSFYRYEDPAYALFQGWQVLLQAGNPVIRAGITAIGSSFDTVPVSSSDWTDSDLFCPLPGATKIYDLVYVANWSENKQHELLFRALAKINRPLRVALLGFLWERTRDDIVALARKYGVADRCEIFEKLPAEEVNRLLNQSRVNLLLSRFEAGNKALYEAMFANLPSVVYRHCEGLDPACMNEQTGILADENQLCDAILLALDQQDRFEPRAWALEHTGYERSTRIVSDKLRELSAIRREPWQTDIAAKVNRPTFAYKNPEDENRLRPALQHLLQFVRT